MGGASFASLSSPLEAIAEETDTPYGLSRPLARRDNHPENVELQGGQSECAGQLRAVRLRSSGSSWHRARRCRLIPSKSNFNYCSKEHAVRKFVYFLGF